MSKIQELESLLGMLVTSLEVLGEMDWVDVYIYQIKLETELAINGPPKNDILDRLNTL